MSSLVSFDQSIYTVPSFTLECGAVLRDAPVAYKTWGKLNAARDNVMVICHALTGSADVQDWWGPMMGRRKAFDPSRFFIFAGNVLGSPYGSASPLTINPSTGQPYGPSFPLTTIRDDVLIHKLVLDHLQITSIAVVIGGSMGGMHVLEWPLCTPPSYVRNIVPLSTSVAHSAWCISWGETQRQCVLADPNFQDGYYTDKKRPQAGLAAARACAMMTYRSRQSFERRFGRKRQPNPAPAAAGSGPMGGLKTQKQDEVIPTPPPSPTKANMLLDCSILNNSTAQNIPKPKPNPKPSPPETVFSAISYLRYQGQKFITRFDANCFIHITHKMDTHDISRDRPSPPSPSSTTAPRATGFTTICNMESILSILPPTLAISIASDLLFPVAEQSFIATHVPNAEHVILDSTEGHDGFLLEFERMNEVIGEFLRRRVPDVYFDNGGFEQNGSEEEGEVEGFDVKKTSIFGEAETEDDFVEFGGESKIQVKPQGWNGELVEPIPLGG